MLAFLPLLLSLLAVDLLAAISPGPNFVAVSQAAVRRSLRDAVSVIFGIAAANLLWCAAVIFGLTALFAVAPWLYRAMHVAGGAYLVVLGVRLWRDDAEEPASTNERIDIGSRRARPGASFLQGLLTNLSNPKSVVYFGSVFTVFMRPGVPAWVEGAAVAIVLFDTVVWYGSVAALFSRGAVRRVYGTVRGRVNRAAGAAMAVFGARLVLARE